MELSVKDKEVKKVVIETEKVYNLELSHEEACAVVAVFGKLGGHVDNDNPRDVTDKIYKALRDAGVSFFSADVSKYAVHVKAEVS